jgi:hypothetical protein
VRWPGVVEANGFFTNSRFVLDTASTHGILTENPTLVAREILDVVDAIVARKALRP